MQGIATSLLLPPMLLVLAAAVGGALAWRSHRPGAAISLAAALGLLVCATPLCAGLLFASLERQVAPGQAWPDSTARPEAIIILAAEAAATRGAPDIGPLTLERLRAGAALHRQTGLPILLSGGPLRRGDPPIAALMATSLVADFGVPVGWVEDRSRDTRDNAVFSIAILRQREIRAAWLVTHAWHLPRAQEAFARAGFTTMAAPVRLDRIPDGQWQDWVPRPDRLGQTWYALREWVGRMVYVLRD